MNLTDLVVESNIPIPEKKKRGRPKGSHNKLEPSATYRIMGVQTFPGVHNTAKGSIPIPHINSRKIEVAVMDDLVKKRGRPKGQGYSIVGSLNKAVAAVEFEEVKETSEQKERTKEQLKEVDWWRKLCSCTHSRTAHKTDGTGSCMICECEHYE